MASPHLERRAVLLGCAAYVGHLALGATASSCGGTTGGKLVELETWVRGDGLDTAGFTNAHGWDIVLHEAKLTRGRLEYYTGDPDGESLAALLRDTLVRRAHAHPGHDEGGDFAGEVLGSDLIDLTAGAVALPRGRAIAGTFRSAHLAFAEVDVMDGAVVELAGEARRRDDVRRFIARASSHDVLSQHDAAEIWGCPFEGDAEVDDDGVVTMTVKPTLWLEDVRFELHGEPDGAPTRLDPLLEPFSAFVAGVRDPSAYVFTYEPLGAT